MHTSTHKYLHIIKLTIYWTYMHLYIGLHIANVVVVVDLGFTTLLTSQVISVALYSEREKYVKFCSEALISAWGSFPCRKYTTRDPRHNFPSEGSHTQDIYALKHPSTPAGFEPNNLGSSGEYDNHRTTGVDRLHCVAFIDNFSYHQIYLNDSSIRQDLFQKNLRKLFIDIFPQHTN